MANVYKRTPNFRELPNGWNNMDAIKFSNINSIQGLQHVDNSLVAKQNGTYNCKNVYQDESGNLTVRPALRYIRNISENAEILGLYETVIGEISHYYDGGYYISSNGLTYEIGKGNIAIQESDNQVYIMFTNISGKLEFKQWNESGLSDFEPDIQTNDPNNLASYRFNLLTDRYYANIPALTEMAYLDRKWKEYNISYDAIFTFDNDIKYNIYINGNGYFIINDLLYIIGDTVRIIALPDDIKDYQSLIIWNDKDDTYLSAIVWNPSKFITYTINRYSLDELNSYDISEDIVPELALAHNKFAGIITGRYGPYAIYDASTEDTLYIAPETYKPSLDNGTSSWGYLFTPVVTNNRIYFLNDERLSTSNITRNAINFSYYDYVSDSTGTRQMPIYVGNNLKSVKAIYNGYEVQYTNDTQVTFFSDEYSGINHQQQKSYNIDSELLYYPATTSVTISDYKNNDFTVFTEDDLISVDMEGYTTGGIYDNGARLIVKDANYWYLLNRTVVVQQFEMFRPISDSFPVLSQLEDEILTSFYLDGIYWFVTKHRVFGTGVANEKFSIKYFDPRKYFHFEETLTGAIRISDSSFWVFHSDGAYLIYKSSSDLYDTASNQYIETITWLCTNTAKSKGCDFENAVITLPVSNYIACVTSDDISSVQMRENVQTDDRILVPMTLGIQKFVASLLNETTNIITGVYKYNALFFLNSQKTNGTVPVLVYNATNDNWWYWELPLNRVIQTNITENGIQILAEISNKYCIYDLYTEYYTYNIGGVSWELYADRLIDSEPTKIEWFWESAILHFDTIDYKKQLLSTSFTFSERETSSISFEYNFEIYDDRYSDRNWSEVTPVIERARTYFCKNIISKFMYLQLYLRNMQDDNFEAYTKPKISAVSFKYRILPGGIL